MNWLHDVTRLGYGWVIVLITILLRGIFWPLMAASTRSMKRMQALAPEMKALKEKYKDDPQKFTQKQMELVEEAQGQPDGRLPADGHSDAGVHRLLSPCCAARSSCAARISCGSADLSKPDTLFMIPGINFPFNLLPLLMGGAMLWQSHLHAAVAGHGPDAGENDALHAADFPGVPLQLLGAAWRFT